MHSSLTEICYTEAFFFLMKCYSHGGYNVIFMDICRSNILNVLENRSNVHVTLDKIM